MSAQYNDLPENLKLTARWEIEPGVHFRELLIKSLKAQKKVPPKGISFPIGGKLNKLVDFMDNEISNGGLYFDLRCINFEDIEIPESVLDHANLEHANLRRANFQKSSFYFAIFRRTAMEDANFEGAKLQSSNFVDAVLTSVNFRGSYLCNADFRGADLSCADLADAEISRAKFKLKTVWWRIGISRIIFLRLENRKLLKNELSLYDNLLQSLLRLFENNNIIKPTILTGTLLKNVKIDSDPILYRDLLDEQYLDSFAEKHKFIYPFWLYTSNCGRNVRPLIIWILFFGFLFSLAYQNYSYPSWFPQWAWLQNSLDIIDPRFLYSGNPQSAWWQPLYLSLITLTAPGVASAQPTNTAGFVWHTFQNGLGFLLLGYAISVLGSKLTRRSA